MAEDIIDIVTRLSYQTNAAALQKDVEQFQKLTTNIEQLNIKLNRLKSDQQQTNNIIDQKQIKRGIEETTKALNQQVAAQQRLVTTSKPLQDAIKRETGLIGQLQSQLKQLQKSRIEATSEAQIKLYNQQITSTQNRLNSLLGVNGGRGSLTTQIGQGLLAGFGIGTGFGLVTRGISEVIGLLGESAELARQTEGVVQAFTRLNDPSLLSNLREATKGTLSDLQLMQKAVEFNNFGLPIQRLGELLNFARVRARETGLSIDYVTNSLVSGIARQSPRILDNLGLSQVKIRNEFKRIGDFAQAAFNIINEEGQKANNTLLTSQDRLDQITAKVKNGEAVFGQFLNYIKLLGIDIGRVFVSDKTVTTFDSYAQEFREAQQTINQEVADAPAVASQAQALFLQNFKQFTDQYKLSDYDTRKTIEKQADDMYAQLIKSAQQWQTAGKKLDDTYFAGLKQAFQQTQAFFKSNALNIDTIREGDIRKLSGEDINDLQTQIKRRRDILSRDDKKDEEKFAQLKKLEDQLAKEENIRAGREDQAAKRRLKQEESLADKRLKLEADLQKKIADLRDEYNQVYLKGEEQTLQRTLDSIGSEYAKALDLLDIQYKQAKEKGLINPAIDALFQQQRGLTNSIFDARFDNAYAGDAEKLASAARQLRERELQDEIRILEQRNELYNTDLDNAIQAEVKKSELAKLKITERYDEEVKLANGNADKIVDINNRKNQELQLAEEKSLQDRVKIYDEYVDAVTSKIAAAYGIVISGVQANTSTQLGRLAQQYSSGNISRSAYTKQSGIISDAGALESNANQQQDINAKLSALYKEQDLLYAQAQAGKDVEKQLDSNQAKIQELNDELGKLQQDEANITISIQNRKQDELQKQLGLLDDLVNATAQAYNQIANIQQQSLDREISIRTERVRQAERLADRGNTEALRREEEYLRRAQQQREQAARRQIVINSALTTSEAILGVVSAASKGDPYTLAARVIAAVIAIGAGIASVSAASRSGTQGLAGFKDGVVDYQGKGTGTSDSNVVRISNGESVMTAEATGKYKNFLTAINRKYDPIPALAKDLNIGSMRGSDSVSRKEFAEYGKKLDRVVEAIEDNKVGVHANISEEGIYVATERVARHTQHTMRG